MRTSSVQQVQVKNTIRISLKKMKINFIIILLIASVKFCIGQCICNDSTTFVDLSNESIPKDYKSTEELFSGKLTLDDRFNQKSIILFFEFTVDCDGNVTNFGYGDRGMRDSVLFQQIMDIALKSKFIPATVEKKPVCERKRYSIHTNSKEFTLASYFFNFEKPNSLYRK